MKDDIAGTESEGYINDPTQLIDSQDMILIHTYSVHL